MDQETFSCVIFRQKPRMKQRNACSSLLCGFCTKAEKVVELCDKKNAVLSRNSRNQRCYLQNLPTNYWCPLFALCLIVGSYYWRATVSYCSLQYGWIGRKANRGIEQPSDKEEPLWIFTAPSERTGGIAARPCRDRSTGVGRPNMADSIFQLKEKLNPVQKRKVKRGKKDGHLFSVFLSDLTLLAGLFTSLLCYAPRYLHSDLL